MRKIRVEKKCIPLPDRYPLSLTLSQPSMSVGDPDKSETIQNPVTQHFPLILQPGNSGYATDPGLFGIEDEKFGAHGVYRYTIKHKLITKTPI